MAAIPGVRALFSARPIHHTQKVVKLGCYNITALSDIFLQSGGLAMSKSGLGTNDHFQHFKSSMAFNVSRKSSYSSAVQWWLMFGQHLLSRRRLPCI
jgi:hypothetical protein